MIFRYFLLSVWTERRNKKEPRTRSAVEQMGFPVSGCGTRGFAAHTVLARDDTEKPHLLPTAPAIVRPANTPPLVVADLQSGFDNDLLFFSDRFELAKHELLGLRFIMPRMMNIGCASAIRASSIALTFVDLERDSAVFEQVHTALTAYSVRLARCLIIPEARSPESDVNINCTIFF